MARIETIVVEPQEENTRVDVLLQTALEKTRSAVQKLLSQGAVTKAGTAIAKNYRVKAGDVLTVTLPEPTPILAVPQDIPLEIVYEDEDLLVVNKPKGMVVHPAPGHPDGTLVNALLYHCGDSLSSINGEIRPGIVHRLDKDTSGLLLVAKNDYAHHHLAEQIATHSFTRLYEAVVYGTFKEPYGKVDLPIGRSQNDRKKMCVTKDGRQAVTEYKALTAMAGFTHVRLKLHTGRTHQIRVHMAYLHHPVAGDLVYGPKNGITTLQGQCLHARHIGFVHPRTGVWLEFTSDLPEYFVKFAESLGKKEGIAWKQDDSCIF